MMSELDQLNKVEISSQEELRSWLMDNHQQSESIWLITFKKSEGAKYVSRWEVLDQLICFGWIDGIRRKVDDSRTMQLISPRKAEHWARTYKERAALLIEEGLMHASGFRSIELSKSKGLWTFMDDVDNLVIPDDLGAELVNREGAAAFFESINPSSKRFVLRWIKLAKTEKTRKIRIEKIAELAAKGEKLPGS